MAEFKISRLRYVWRGDWATATTYNRDDIVQYGGSSWLCIRQHTSTTFAAAQLFLQNPGDTEYSPAWRRTTGGSGFLGTWAPSTSYVEGSIVQSGGNLYVANTDHQSSALFNTNIAYWDLLAVGKNWRLDWAPSTIYKTGDVVKYNGITYECVLEHTSPSNSVGITLGNNDGNDDSTLETWKVVVDNIEYRGDHTVNTVYRLNDLVKYGGSIFRCTDEHTSNLIQNIIDDTKFTLEFKGFNYNVSSWNSTTAYALGDIVKQGGQLYISNSNNLNSQPGQSATYSTGNPSWTVISKAINFAGNYSSTASYKTGDLVYRNGYLYIALQDTVADGSTDDYLDTSNWQVVIPGTRWRGRWNSGVSYGYGDTVIYRGGTWVANEAHVSGTASFPGSTAFSEPFDPWTLVSEGDEEDAFESIGDLITYNNRFETSDSSFGAVKVPIGFEDQLLEVTDNSGSLGYNTWGTTARILYVRKNGLDDDLDPGRGTNYFKPFKTVAFAAAYADDDYQYNTTIKVSTGIYEEILPIVLPARVAIVGEELRAVTIQANEPLDYYPSRLRMLDIIDRIANLSSGIILGTPVTKTPGNIEDQVILTPATSVESAIVVALYQDIKDKLNYDILGTGTPPTVTGSNTASSDSNRIAARLAYLANKQFIGHEAIAYMQQEFPGVSFDEQELGNYFRQIVIAIANDLLYPGNYKSVQMGRFYANTQIGSSHEDMFYVRDATGIRNCTLKGLVGTLPNPVGLEPYSRPDGGNYVSLDPGWGPNDEKTWILTRSCYVQNVTTFGYGATGQKIDGALHNGGNKSIVSNDFTQVISDGVGCHVLNGGRAELVSVFTYYAHIGMFAEDGGIIRATNGNSSYGTFGAVADGIDPTETPQIAKVNTRNQEAIVTSAFAGEANDFIFLLEFENAGQQYTTASYTITSSGINASCFQEEIRDNAIYTVDILSEGANYVVAGRQAQTGNTTTITLASNETIEESEIIGTRIILTSGPGTGQYGYVTAYNNLTKLLTVYKESNGTPGWDHLIPGYPLTDLLTTGTRYVFEPRITFSHPGFAVTSITLDDAYSWTGIAYGETYEVYLAISPGIIPEGTTAPIFNIIKTARVYTAVNIVSGGTGFSIGDTFTIAGDLVGGTDVEHDIEVTVTNVSSGVIITITWTGIARSGRFVLIPSSGQATKHSIDGDTWISGNLPTNANWKSICWGENRFVTVARNSDIAAYSDDGVTWTQTTLPASRLWNSVAYGDSIFVAVAENQDAGAYSGDGVNWSSTTLPDIGDSSTNEWVDIAYGNGRFVAIAKSANAVAKGVYSGGVITWTAGQIEVQDSSLNDWKTITYGNGRFVAISSQGYVSYSFDGLNWYTVTKGMPPDDSNEIKWQQCRYGQGVFFAVGITITNNPTIYSATSEDGIIWTDRELADSLIWNVIGFGTPDITLGDSTISSKTGMWIAAPLTASNKINKILTGARAKGRVVVESQAINLVKIWDPGSGYLSDPSITITDPGNTQEATFRLRRANGVLGQPTWTNRGSQYKTSTTTVTITGDGFADVTPVGKFITIDGLTTMPGPGAQFYIGGDTDYYTAVITNLETGTDENGLIRSTFRVNPAFTALDYIQDDMEVIIRERYSQCRITGHDFLDVGTGNFDDTNYPGLYLDYVFTREPQNEIGNLNGGRVFYTSTDQDGNFRAGELFRVEQATGIITLSADFFDLAGLTEIALGGVIVGGSGTVIREFSTDPLFTQNSNNIIPTQRAIKAYLQSRLNIGGEDLLTASFIAGTVRVGPNLINSTASLTINFGVNANFAGTGAAIQGSILAQTMFFRSFKDD